MRSSDDAPVRAKPRWIVTAAYLIKGRRWSQKVARTVEAYTAGVAARRGILASKPDAKFSEVSLHVKRISPPKEHDETSSRRVSKK